MSGGEEEGLITLLDLHDAGAERLRVEHDHRDRRSYLTIGEPQDEHVFELGPDQGTRIIGALSDLPAPPSTWGGGKGVKVREPVQHAAPAVKTPTPQEEMFARLVAAWARVPDLPLREIVVKLGVIARNDPDDWQIVAMFEAHVAGIVDRRVDAERTKHRERKPVQP